MPLCAGKPQTLQFAKDVINEIRDIFPSPYIHIGGDECPKERWKECERCQAKIAELGLKNVDGHSKEEQLQTWFMDEVAKQIRARGRKMIGWDEIRIWTEWVKDAKKMEWELLPRLAALCEVQWTQKEQRNLDSFLQRMLHIHDIYRLKNLNYKEDIEAAVKK